MAILNLVPLWELADIIMISEWEKDILFHSFSKNCNSKFVENILALQMLIMKLCVHFQSSQIMSMFFVSNLGFIQIITRFFNFFSYHQNS